MVLLIMEKENMVSFMEYCDILKHCYSIKGKNCIQKIPKFFVNLYMKVAKF